MGRTELIAEMHRHRLVAVVRSKSAEEALETAAAVAAGGPHFARQILAPFPDIRLMVSGGVDENNVKECAALGVTGICLGSAGLRDGLLKEGRKGLAKQVAEFVKLVEEARGAQNVRT